MTNMIKYQHGYNATARVITAMDEMIDTIINRMGTVGR
jgi:flagellar hook-associated protein 1 FlgK